MSISMSGRVFFSAFNINTTGTWIYNDSLGVAATSGWIGCKTNHVLVQYACATLERSGGVELRIEGKFTGYDRVASVQHLNIAGANGIDKLYNVTERFDYIRVGAKCGTNKATATDLAASPIALYVGMNLTETW